MFRRNKSKEGGGIKPDDMVALTSPDALSSSSRRNLLQQKSSSSRGGLLFGGGRRKKKGFSNDNNTTWNSSSPCKNRSASSTTTTIEVREAIAVILLIAFTLPFFYIIGIWLGTTLSTSTEKIHETSLRSSSSSNNNQAATIIDHPVGINSEGRSNFFLSWFFGSKNVYAVPEYRFPTVDERFQYYMGDWYNKTDWQLTTCQGLVHLDDNTTRDTFRAAQHGQSEIFGKYTDSIFSLETLESCKHVHSYCQNAYDTLRKAKNSSSRNLAMFKFGDSRTKMTSHPVVCKSRPALLKHLPSPIIWPLNTKRHYGQLEELWRGSSSNELEWKDKEAKIFWRGATTGERVELLKRWIHYDRNVIDIAFHKIGSSLHDGFLGNYLESYNKRQKAGMSEMLKYKYLLSVEGNDVGVYLFICIFIIVFIYYERKEYLNSYKMSHIFGLWDVATGLKWMLYSNSVVLMSPPTVSTWAMEDLLLPFVHYIPLADDYSNLLEMLQWAEQHQDACQVISKRATDFIDKLWLSEQARIDTEILRERLATAYVTQFHAQLATCDLNKNNTLILRYNRGSGI